MKRHIEIFVGMAKCGIILSLLAVAFEAEGQLPFMQTRVMVSEAAQILPASSSSDAQAVQVLERVLEASGGTSAWRNVRSAKVRLSVTTQNAANAHEFLMLDDWSTDAVRYRRGAVGSGKTPRDHEGQSTFNASDSGQGAHVAEFDQARVLAGSLPAAAAEIILKKSSYVAKVVTGSRSTDGITCVDIYRQSSSNGAFVREEEWLISKSTGLPTTVDIILPNLTGTRQTYEEFQFDQFKKIDGLTIPSVITMRHPNGNAQTRTVKEFSANAEYSKPAFDKEIAR